MNLLFDSHLADSYSSSSQKIRVLSEDWVEAQIFCPNCGAERINRYANNRPVADLFCQKCEEDFELKGKQNFIGSKIVDGAYSSMIERLTSLNNPNFFLMTYEPAHLKVTNFVVIPKHFFVPEIIEKRKPLSKNAHRAGWVGCNIILSSIPDSGKIYYVRNGKTETKKRVLNNWKKTLFLREEKEIPAKGWLIDVMRSVERIGKKEFSLEDVYTFEKDLSKFHPNNKHIKDKIRQQLQVLRDRDYLQFLGNGKYKLTS